MFPGEEGGSSRYSSLLSARAPSYKACVHSPLLLCSPTSTSFCPSEKRMLRGRNSGGERVEYQENKPAVYSILGDEDRILQT
eukprot:scaffold219461_cov32-Tisochrysis_lutea.AAC.1